MIDFGSKTDNSSKSKCLSSHSNNTLPRKFPWTNTATTKNYQTDCDENEMRVRPFWWHKDEDENGWVAAVYKSMIKASDSFTNNDIQGNHALVSKGPHPPTTNSDQWARHWTWMQPQTNAYLLLNSCGPLANGFLCMMLSFLSVKLNFISNIHT